MTKNNIYVSVSHIFAVMLNEFEFRSPLPASGKFSLVYMHFACWWLYSLLNFAGFWKVSIVHFLKLWWVAIETFKVYGSLLQYLDIFLTRVDGLRRRLSLAEDRLDFSVLRDTFQVCFLSHLQLFYFLAQSLEKNHFGKLYFIL